MALPNQKSASADDGFLVIAVAVITFICYLVARAII